MRNQALKDKVDRVLLESDLTSIIAMDAKGNLQRSGRRIKTLCTLHEERTPSMTIDEDKQAFTCFGCGASGDVINYIQQSRNMSFNEALDYLGGDETIAALPKASARKEYVSPILQSELSIPEKASTFPANQETPWIFNPQNEERPFMKFKPSAVHEIRSVDGSKRLGYVLRVVNTNKDGTRRKFTPTVTYCEFDYTDPKTGEVKTKVGWALVPFGQNGQLKPLYRQEMLSQLPDAPVIIHEGEKATDAGYDLLDKVVHLTWLGGTNGLTSRITGDCAVDLSPLKDREVIIAPDFDAAGYKAAAVLAVYVFKAGARSLRIVTPPVDDNPMKGWDIADGRDAGWTSKEFVEHIQKYAQTMKKFAASNPEVKTAFHETLGHVTKASKEMQDKADKEEEQAKREQPADHSTSSPTRQTTNHDGSSSAVYESAHDAQSSDYASVSP